MSGDLKQLIDKVAKTLKNAGAREVYLFGSAATGKIRENSDLDFAVSGLPPESFFEAFGNAADIAGREIDLVDLDENNPFTRYLKEEGELQRVA